MKTALRRHRQSIVALTQYLASKLSHSKLSKW
uniref:Uncharacterized protein n=1 Tax=Arundo donax TaxID=35708 RepID=A0A0A9A7F9_ARUDO